MTKPRDSDFVQAAKSSVYFVEYMATIGEFIRLLAPTPAWTHVHMMKTFYNSAHFDSQLVLVMR